MQNLSVFKETHPILGTRDIGRAIEFYTPNDLRDTSWGAREFALYDVDHNALTFYRQLNKDDS